MRSFIVHRLGDYRKSGLLSRQGQQLQPSLAEPLKGIGGAARLECTASERGCPRVFYKTGGLEDLLFRLDRAGAGDDRHVDSAKRNSWRDRNDGVFGAPFTRDLLVGLSDVDYLHHAGQRSDSR